MSKKVIQFETIEQAIAAYNELNTSSETDKVKLASVEKELKEVKDERNLLLEEREGLKSANDKAIEVVQELSERLELQETHGGQKGLLITHKKKNYRISGTSFNVPGLGVISAEELSKNEKALDRLIKIKSSVLTAI